MEQKNINLVLFVPFDLRKRLFAGAPPGNKKLFAGAPPGNKNLFAGSPPGNKNLFAGAPPGNKSLFAGAPSQVSVIPPEMKNKHRERSFFLAKECKFGVKNIKILYVRDSLFFTTLIKLSVTNGI